MDKIASFCIDHTKLLPGIYISRVDSDIITYDIRFKKPNCPPFLENSTIHTIEHLFATFARNLECRDNIIYFGPMGCRTGFYFLVRNIDPKLSIQIIIDIIKEISIYSGDIPGRSQIECGNWLEHNLDGAIKEAREFYETIIGWEVEKLQY